MIPELFTIFGIPVYSYGLMLGISFFVANYLLTIEFKRNKLDPNIASTMIILALVFGIAGSRLFSLLENWEDFINHPIEMIFSPGGLTYYGGMLTVIIVFIVYLRKKKLNFLLIGDIAAPALAIAYGIGRIGCQLAGDGDYGLPTRLPWGTIFANGTVKPAHMLSDYMLTHPEVAKQFNYSDLSKTVVASDKFGYITQFDLITKMHPTPIYETIMAALVFAVLWSFRKKNLPLGTIFFSYLILSSIARFFVEFMRLNPNFMFGLSEAQTISVVLFIAGIIGIVYQKKKSKIASSND